MLAALLLALTAATSHPYRPCAHLPGQPGPAIPTAAGAAAVRAEIAAEVDALGGSPAFARYLTHVAARESSLRPGVIHQLGEDQEASWAAYRRLGPAHKRAGNPYAELPEVWLTYGLFGLNSNYHSRRLHPRADPRALCKVKVSVATYALAAQDVLRRMRRCAPTPTWADVHRAIQRGNLCPDGRRENLPAAIGEAPARLADVGG